MTRPPHKCNYCHADTTMLEIGYICTACRKVFDLDGNTWFGVDSDEKVAQLAKEYRV